MAAEAGDSDATNNIPSQQAAWKIPSNDVVEPLSVSWPALSEATRPSPRSASASQGQVINRPSPREGNGNSSAGANTRHNLNANHGVPARQRSTRQRGGGNNNNGVSSLQGSLGHGPPPQPPLPPPFPVYDPPLGTLVRPVVVDSSVRGTRPIGGAVPQPDGPNDHPTPTYSPGRRNFSPRPRGDGQNRYNLGGRHDQELRNAHVPLYAPPVPPFVLPPPSPGTPPPYGPLPMRPFPGPMGFDMAPPHTFVPTLPLDSFRGAPLIAPGPPPPPIFFPFMQPNLRLMVLHQIDYYFSDANLARDDFLRSNMDDEGWVHISLIANFNRVAKLTSNTSFILDCMQASNVVEVEGDKLRRRDDWRMWLHTPASLTNDSAPHTTGESSENTLVGSMQNVTLDDVTESSSNSASPLDVEVASTELQSVELTAQPPLDIGQRVAEDTTTQ